MAWLFDFRYLKSYVKIPPEYYGLVLCITYNELRPHVTWIYFRSVAVENLITKVYIGKKINFFSCRSGFISSSFHFTQFFKREDLIFCVSFLSRLLSTVMLEKKKVPANIFQIRNSKFLKSFALILMSWPLKYNDTLCTESLLRAVSVCVNPKCWIVYFFKTPSNNIFTFLARDVARNEFHIQKA